MKRLRMRKGKREMMSFYYNHKRKVLGGKNVC